MMKTPKLKFDFFRSLPPEITTDILSRLPIRTIAICKCVGKPWRDLLRSREFVDFHLSKSVPGFVIGYDRESKNYRVFEFNDELGLEDHDLHYNQVIKFNAMGETEPYCFKLKCSANGLLLFQTTFSSPSDLHICNPLTREYIQLSSDGIIGLSVSSLATCGFGVSKTTGQYKVVGVFLEIIRNPRVLRQTTRPVCFVYVLGTGSWRRITPPAPYKYNNNDWCGVRFGGVSVSLNGNLHWLVEVSKGSYCISCFDLETEFFSPFAIPPLVVNGRFLVFFVMLGESLCLCDTKNRDEIVIWLMKEYGDERSWTKEYVIGKNGCDDRIYGIAYPIKVFKDGDILMAWCDDYMFYYSNETKTSTRIDMFCQEKYKGYKRGGLRAMLHTSSFLSLRSFLKERVLTF